MNDNYDVNFMNFDQDNIIKIKELSVEYNIKAEFDEILCESESNKFDALVIKGDNDNTINQIIDVKNKEGSIVWLLTDTEIEAHRLAYLKLGSDLLLSNNICNEELCFVLQKTLNRESKNVKNDSISPDENGIFLIKENRSLKIGRNEEILLTRIEYNLMILFKNNPNKVVSYEEIYKNIWEGYDQAKMYRINNIIFHLREKMESIENSSKLIQTIRSKGFVFKNENLVEVSMDDLYKKN